MTFLVFVGYGEPSTSAHPEDNPLRASGLEGHGPGRVNSLLALDSGLTPATHAPGCAILRTERRLAVTVCCIATMARKLTRLGPSWKRHKQRLEMSEATNQHKSPCMNVSDRQSCPLGKFCCANPRVFLCLVDSIRQASSHNLETLVRTGIFFFSGSEAHYSQKITRGNQTTVMPLGSDEYALSPVLLLVDQSVNHATFRQSVTRHAMHLIMAPDVQR